MGTRSSSEQSVPLALATGGGTNGLGCLDVSSEWPAHAWFQRPRAHKLKKIVGAEFNHGCIALDDPVAKSYLLHGWLVLSQ